MNESIRLLSTKDGSDKEYRVQLEAKAEGFIVTGFNGRRGGPLKAQQKIASPVPYEEAKKTYDDLVKSKIKGGYNFILEESHGEKIPEYLTYVYNFER